MKTLAFNTLVVILVTVLIFTGEKTAAQNDTVVYRLTINQGKVKIAGRESMGMTVNGSVPGPTLRFTEGEYAVMYVKNEMDVETSVHWHGLLLPNFYDGVPYLTTPPIEPGNIQKYEFPLIQAGTYWYHSHTMLQEQSGVYGSIIIEPKEPSDSYSYDHEQVLVLSDWTFQKPRNVLRNLKRGNEWYNVRKGTATPLNQVIARGALGAQLDFWRQRMEGADIADIYYPAFLTNGDTVQYYTKYEAGDKVRLRIINAAASSQFWLTFGGAPPLLISADGLDVVPVEKDRLFISIAETYDLIVTIPESGQIQMRAMAQDGSGATHAYFGSGPVLAAEVLPRPDKIGMMMQMAEMDMRMGAPAMKFNPSEVEPYEFMREWGMQMEHGEKTVEGMDMEQDAKMEHGMNREKMPAMEHDSHEPAADTLKTDHASMHHGQTAAKGQPVGEPEMPGMGMFAEYNYDFLQAPATTAIDENQPEREILLNLTGNMWRYIWSMNGVPLAEADMIKIEKGEKVRIIFNNLTMMHHPMHLHGHFFRVLNKHGAYSPLKHTVNVAPMQKTIIEFDASEDSDWFLHCHVLYHMVGGMARAITYQTARNPLMKEYPRKILFNEGNHLYTWGLAEVASHMTELNLVSSNIRNQFNLNVEFGYNQNLEAELTYERYLYDYFRVFAGVNVENEMDNSLDEVNPVAVAGIRYFTPYMFNLDVRIDHKLRPELRLSREIMIFPRTFIFGEYEHQFNFGWVERSGEPQSLDQSVNFEQEITWSAGLEYMLNRNFSLMSSYDNRFGAGGGLTVRF
ncbi:multicopper oxidase domain-containing protein [Pontibacter pamirensis]|uniref:multicopper oxidase domain-containing protein n=1 Tax=Pontibacter pamirensis TaxID=2562824 RepID=UPI001389CF88|nr:multicopper oxidase domain-containing protein [Pontibacter pamirensis]